MIAECIQGPLTYLSFVLDKEVLKQGCRCIEIDLWDGDSPSSSEVEGDKDDSKDVNKLSGLLKKKLNRLRSKSDPKETEPDTPGKEAAMPVPWRTASGRSEPVVYHGYTATKEISFRKVGYFSPDLYHS